VPELSILMPVYNELDTVETAIREVVEADLPVDGLELVIVDDGSTDGTSRLLDTGDWPEWVRILRHERNRGKGAAVRTALGRTTGEIVVIQDADMEYDPADVVDLVRPIVEGYADVVYGSRLTGGRPQRAYMFWHLVGNRALSILTGLLFNTTISDMETGYKVFRAEVLRELKLTQDDFGIEPEITGEICLRGMRVYEVPISYYGRTYEEGKNITWRDGFKAVWVLFAVRMRRPRAPERPGGTLS
jgi:glycosyltransferase involved in cell wall biosynthesis